MNNSIHSNNSQEKSVFVFGTKELYFEFLKAGIDKEDISIDDSDAIYLKAEHFTHVEKICLPHGLFPQLMDIPFKDIKKSDVVSFLQSKTSSLLKHHGDNIAEYVSLQNALATIEDEDIDIDCEPIGVLLDQFKERNKQTRQKEILGLEVPFIESIKSHMFGLRGLIALVAAPNCGKTVLVTQMILEALDNNPDVCAVFVSLEMKKDVIIERMVRAEAELTFAQMNLKSDTDYSDDINTAIEKIRSYEKRFIIIGKENCRSISAHKLIKKVNQLKQMSGCSRSILVIDYLQLWPIDSEQLKLKTDLEADKWLMAQMQILQNIYVDDPAVVICEARKSAGTVTPRLTLADISGSARLGYGFEAALSLNPYTEDEHMLALGKTLLGIKNSEIRPKSDNAEVLTRIMRKTLFNYGYAFSELEMLKIREGDRFKEMMVLDYRRNTFFGAKISNGDLESFVNDVRTKYNQLKQTDS